MARLASHFPWEKGYAREVILSVCRLCVCGPDIIRMRSGNFDQKPQYRRINSWANLGSTDQDFGLCRAQ
ncbi:hypothetical protein KSX_48640 [Ktedonospora formicarum]|uniref:Uncharacterized protein n=1 Tax=Ktedonospora formicarum TaxID=2778364 RepID=A0A8J3I0S3_9CHLR|nr:hypothetical protein KSX_48640 [Ktedonospora formicarum]